MEDEYEKTMGIIEDRQEKFWDSLTKDEQLMVFCCVSRRICQGELIDKGSYRHILYSVFGFDLSSYTQAHDAGYMAIHNAIYYSDEPEVDV